MGNSTGSMFYAFGAFLLIYIVGVLIYQCYLWIKKWRDKKNVYQADADVPDAGASGGAPPAGDVSAEEETPGKFL